MSTIAEGGIVERAASRTGDVEFRARGVAFKAVIKPSHRKITEHGQEFVAGEYADFAPNGLYRTSDQRIIDHLRSIPTFNTEFFEVGAELGRDADPAPVLEAIMQATIELDDERLSQIESEERAGHNRGTVLQSAAAARQQVQLLGAAA